MYSMVHLSTVRIKKIVSIIDQLTIEDNLIWVKLRVYKQ